VRSSRMLYTAVCERSQLHKVVWSQNWDARARSRGLDIPLTCPSSSILRAIIQLVAHAARVKPWLAGRNGG
jgi:hypothetical protein